MNKPKSDHPDRPYLNLTDVQLAHLLLKMESALEKSQDDDGLEPILLIRHNLIEEIIYRYQNQEA